MPLKKIILLIVSLSVLVALVIFLLQLSKHPQLDKARFSLKDKIRIFLSNLSDTVAPARKPPLSTLEIEQNLVINLPTPFENFRKKDWDHFWNLLYGRFAEDSGGWPKRSRQLTQEEVEAELGLYYSRPFSFFGTREWEIFWKSLLKGKVF